MNIGGPLDYRKLAELNRPQNPEQIQAEIRRLSESGLTAVDIATALRMNHAQVLEMLARPAA